MLDTLIMSFKLRNAYRVNGVIYSLKSIPVIKKLLPASLYASRGLKRFANVISAILEALTIFSGKALYLMMLYLFAMELETPPADTFAHALIFLTIIGGLMNTQIFNPTRDKFYAIVIMRMDAKANALINYGCFLLKQFIGLSVCALVFGRACGVSVPACLALPVYVVCVKLCSTALMLALNKDSGTPINENSVKPIIWIVTGALLLAATLPPIFGCALSEKALIILGCALAPPAAFALAYILRYKEYRAVYKALLSPDNFVNSARKGAAGAAQQLVMQKKIVADTSITSDKSGYKYFNELFVKRHAKLLTRSAKRITAAAAVFFALAMAACLIFPDVKLTVNGLLLTYLPYFLFVMYLINRGKNITLAMFLNCDHSMLAYRFYRQPKALLLLFVERLKSIVKINLMPAAVVAAGLPLLLMISGGTDQPLNYALLFVSIIAMSVFFSVHTIVLYYLLQPYNMQLEMKSAAYGIINWITYFICYSAIQLKISTLIFGSAISAFCVIYTLAALLLAYRLAPRTFKLRQ